MFLLKGEKKIGHREFRHVFLAFPVAGCQPLPSRLVRGSSLGFFEAVNLVAKRLGSFPAFFKRLNFSTDGKVTRRGFLCWNARGLWDWGNGWGQTVLREGGTDAGNPTRLLRAAGLHSGAVARGPATCPPRPGTGEGAAASTQNGGYETRAARPPATWPRRHKLRRRALVLGLRPRHRPGRHSPTDR